ncbi:tautomerase family protein [Candidatus Margulisiibacteriota bacterium]
MAQVKIFGLIKQLPQIKDKLSDLIHSALMEVFELPETKRFQRFIGLGPGDFIFPKDRSENYLIIEISVFEGRLKETKKKLITLLIKSISKELNIHENDIEITIFETPKSNWGIRGQCGDDLALNYKVSI